MNKQLREEISYMINRRKFLKSTALGILGFHLTNSQLLSLSKPNDEVSALLRKIMISEKNIGGVISQIAYSQIGKPYIGGTLDIDQEEKLIYQFDGYDCLTFVETVLALARITVKNKVTLEAFKHELTSIRYNKGIINGYASRSHYTSEWISSNKQLGIIKDLSKELGGELMTNEVNFMSTHPQFYKALTADSTLISHIEKNEAVVNNTQRYYIPKSKLEACDNKIQSGDILVIATSKSGLDYSHLGFAYRPKSTKKLHFLHASSNEKKVILDGEFSKYLDKSKSAIGFSLIRPI